MENIVLTIHLILALALVGIVLIQRSEGGGLGLGGGGGGDGIMSGRGAATALSKITWVLAVGFIITSMSLTIIASRNANSSSIFDRLGNESQSEDIDTELYFHRQMSCCHQSKVKAHRLFLAQIRHKK